MSMGARELRAKPEHGLATSINKFRLPMVNTKRAGAESPSGDDDDLRP